MIFINSLRCNFEFVVPSKYIASYSLDRGVLIALLYPFGLRDGLWLAKMGHEFGSGYDGAESSGGMLNMGPKSLKLVLGGTP